MHALPDVMTAIDPAEPGGPEVLVPVERPVPRPGAGEVLVKVAAAGVNRPDVLQRQGAYPPPPGAPSIPITSGRMSVRSSQAAAMRTMRSRPPASVCRCRRR
jgi:NADPH:quinone reductase-like Zn-dependent oxidoreductase